MTITARRRALTVDACDAQWVRAADDRVANRAEWIRVRIRDRVLSHGVVDMSTLRHYGGLIRTLRDRGVDVAPRHTVWFREFCQV